MTLKKVYDLVDHFNYKEKAFIVTVLVIPFVVILVLTNYFRCNIMPIKIGITELGQLGDFYGGILNPLIAYIGLVSVVIALLANKYMVWQAIASVNAAEKQIAQSNSIALFQAFIDVSLRARSKKNNIIKARNNILQSISYGNKKIVIDSITDLCREWGGVARCIQLLWVMVNSDNIDKIVYEAALATLEIDEVEYIVLCLGCYDLELAKKIIELNVDNLSKGIPDAIEFISKIIKK